MRDTYDGWLVRYETDDKLQYQYLIYSITNSLGIMNDVAIKIDNCQDVWSTTAVSIQSQLRLGLKDYGSNYRIIEGIINYLQFKAGENQRNYLYCKTKHD